MQWIIWQHYKNTEADIDIFAVHERFNAMI